jgi:ABC-type amino acid transport substrate-binding protein
MRVVLSAVILAVLPVLVSGCEMVAGSAETTALGEADEIIVASHLAYPPFEVSQGGEPQGFDIELMNEIADRAGFQVAYRNVPFDAITQGLTVNNFDAAISAMTITEVRRGQVDFSEPYYAVSEALVVSSASRIESQEDLAAKTIGVQPGVTDQPKVREFVASAGVAEIRTLPTRQEVFAGLRDGSLDGVIHDLPASQAVVQESGGELKVVEVIPTGKHYGIAFPKDSTLLEPVNEALAEIKADGTYEEIYERWIGYPTPEIP